MEILNNFVIETICGRTACRSTRRSRIIYQSLIKYCMGSEKNYWNWFIFVGYFNKTSRKSRISAFRVCIVNAFDFTYKLKYMVRMLMSFGFRIS